MKEAVDHVFIALFVVFVSMWFSSYSYYNSWGLDADTWGEHGIVSAHYRIRWPGEGSFWVGWASREYPARDRTPAWPDLGGVFFGPPEIPGTRSPWNRYGFWWIDYTWEHLRSPVLFRRREFWLGVPAWLPALGIALLAIVWHGRKSAVLNS